MRALGIAFLLFVTAAFAGDISGKWDFTSEWDGGSQQSVFVFQQKGDQLTGKYTGESGESELSGTVKDDTLEFDILSIEVDGEKKKVHCKGKVESTDAISGTFDIPGVVNGTWKGARAKTEKAGAE